MHDARSIPSAFPASALTTPPPPSAGDLVIVLDQHGNPCFLSDYASDAAGMPLADLARADRFWSHLFPEAASRERLQTLCRRVSSGELPSGQESTLWGQAARPCHWTITRLRAPGQHPAGLLLVGMPSEPPPSPRPELSPRERQVITLLADGMRTKDIAQHLGLSPRTIDVYRANLMRKLGCHSLVDVIKHALHYPN